MLKYWYIFNDTNEVLKAMQMVMFIYTLVLVFTCAFINNPTFTEEQNNKILATSVGKVIFNEIIPDSFAYINEPTQENLEDKTPDKYFVDPTQLGEGGLKAYFEEQELTATFQQKILR